MLLVFKLTPCCCPVVGSSKDPCLLPRALDSVLFSEYSSPSKSVIQRRRLLIEQNYPAQEFSNEI
jgi:hypothetical protein